MHGMRPQPLTRSAHSRVALTYGRAVIIQRPQAKLACETAEHGPEENQPCTWGMSCDAKAKYTSSVGFDDSDVSVRFDVCIEHHARIHQYYASPDPNPVAELRHLLRTWATGFVQACREHPTEPFDEQRTGFLNESGLGIEDEEAAAFLRAWRAELVIVAEDGNATLPRISYGRDANPLLGRTSDQVALRTEQLTTIGVVGELVLDEQWSERDLAVNRGEFDVVGLQGQEPRLAALVRARAQRPDPDPLETIRDSFLRRSEDPEAKIPTQHEKKWHALHDLATHGPIDLRLAASGTRWKGTAEIVDDRLRVRFD